MSFTPTPAYVTVPLPGGNTSQEPTALYQLQEAASQDINDYQMFLSAANGSQYASPAAYSANLIAYAKSLCNYSWSSYTCVGFDPVAQGQTYANLVFAALAQIILPSTGKSVYDTWIANPPKVTGGGVPVNSPTPFKASSVPGVVVPVNPNYNPASYVQPTPVVMVTPPSTMSGQQPTGVLPTIQQTQAGNTSAMFLPDGTVNPNYIAPVPGIPNPSLTPDYITQGQLSQGVTSDNLSQSQVAAQGGQDVQYSPAPASTNVLTSLTSSLPTLPFGLTWTEVGIGLGALVVGMIMSSGNGGGRSRRY